jgi:2-keto-4-pentenoate hydratase
MRRPPTSCERLRAGWLVFSGGLTTAVPVVTAEFDGLGTVEVHGR